MEPEGLNLGGHGVWIALLAAGILVGAAVTHYGVEPFLNQGLATHLSDCKSSLNLVNQEVKQCYRDLENARDGDLQPKRPPSDEWCQQTENGWSCELTRDRNTGFELTAEQKALETQFKQACEAQGGRWVCYGFCTPQYARQCEFAFSDAGQLCSDSSECKGGCVPLNENCAENCLGSCSQYPLTCFSLYVELVGGKPVVS